MKIQDFDFDLPQTLIAQYPPQQRTASKLLYLDAMGALRDLAFFDLVQHLHTGDVLVLNDTRVIKARLFGRKASGAQVELLIERVLDAHHALVHLRPSRRLKLGQQLLLKAGQIATILARNANLWTLTFSGGLSVQQFIEQHGELPLPPYIHHQPMATDEARYQTVFARHNGAIAAPTAGLHFDNAMLNRLKEQGVEICYLTLHVGSGTFRPIRGDIASHKMHKEAYVIPDETAECINTARAQGRRIIAVGTTTLRALETAQQQGCLIAKQGETDMFITPGYRFQVVDCLLTNFHLPKSTLLMLVSAFAGIASIHAAYTHAINHQYRFFSYGDAMFIERQGRDREKSLQK